MIKNRIPLRSSELKKNRNLKHGKINLIEHYRKLIIITRITLNMFPLAADCALIVSASFSRSVCFALSVGLDSMFFFTNDYYKGCSKSFSLSLSRRWEAHGIFGFHHLLFELSRTSI